MAWRPSGHRRKAQRPSRGLSPSFLHRTNRRDRWDPHWKGPGPWAHSAPLRPVQRVDQLLKGLKNNALTMNIMGNVEESHWYMIADCLLELQGSTIYNIFFNVFYLAIAIIISYHMTSPSYHLFSLVKSPFLLVKSHWNHSQNELHTNHGNSSPRLPLHLYLIDCQQRQVPHAARWKLLRNVATWYGGAVLDDTIL